jgi:hypothetical protein
MVRTRRVGHSNTKSVRVGLILMYALCLLSGLLALAKAFAFI